jgi:enterochelin esterase-like enzyme
VESIEVPSQLLPRPLQARLYLPPCFDPRAAQPYALLVLLHGQGFDAGQWERLGLPTRADALIARGQIPPLLIAMPYEQDSLADPNDSPYAQALVEELLPWLSDRYAACARRDCRAVGGLSRGAAWAVRAALGFEQPFTALGLHSPAPFYGDYNRLPYLVREIAPGNLPALWMDTGSRDRYLSQARHYHALLQEYDVPHEYHLFAGEHDEIYWTRGVERYLRWYGKQFSGQP